jgi:FolB domain-containing protein
VSEPNPAADSLHLEQLEVDTRIGVTDEERATPQRIVINLTIWPNTTFEKLHDDIERTINYVELCRATREFVQSRKWKLIETLASDVSAHLIDKFLIQSVQIEVQKFVLPNTAYVSAIVRRTKAG